ncbi:Uncharacterised protein [Legionella pneumophila]|uniref:Uncharacterized protein n=1 Tax=Legionella pneumophila subsp. pneumophila TaxID=91891 RepID=A0A3A6UN04_LEGPN|nr:hypothetical protein DMC17_10025 [Legionella pneumophila]RJY25261.1 hypothetical protein D1H99_09675 [Legionella pneumophila subsp. pneumophila]RJY30854.1 hypothetical protein D1I00_04830 [Legionella pneumophila subsp. pneumophila]RJY34173.1 hypothetical protein D1H98_05110 [Legionella pneumophila subsp. pneumophila]RJY37782.1 hypothetical protein D1I03_04820 [Legionella pneumophila subsp. pneumophila]
MVLIHQYHTVCHLFSKFYRARIDRFSGIINLKIEVTNRDFSEHRCLEKLLWFIINVKLAMPFNAKPLRVNKVKRKASLIYSISTEVNINDENLYHCSGQNG